jgi:hypothetical protein
VSLDATTEYYRSGESTLSLAVSGRWRSARGKNTVESKGRAAHPAPEPPPEGEGSSCSGVVASELDTRPELTGLFEGGVIHIGRGTEVPGPITSAPEGVLALSPCPEAGRRANVFASNCATSSPKRGRGACYALSSAAEAENDAE